jgi:hypothetical protein
MWPLPSNAEVKNVWRFVAWWLTNNMHVFIFYHSHNVQNPWRDVFTDFISILCTMPAHSCTFIICYGFWQGLIVYFSFIRHGLHRKWRVRQFFCCFMCHFATGTFTERCLATVKEYTDTQTAKWSYIPTFIFFWKWGKYAKFESYCWNLWTY